MSRVNTKLRASILAALLTTGFSHTSYASFSTEGSASSDEASEYDGKLLGVSAGKSVSGLLHGEYKSSWAGVIKLGLYEDGTQISTAGTFCTDIHHPTSVGATYDTSKEAMSCKLKYLVNTYPAQFSGINNTEAAARQSAVWYFADGFELISPSSVKERQVTIIADVEENAADACATYEKPIILSMTSNAVAVYEGDTVTYTVTAKRDGQPVEGKQINLSTDFGALSVTSVTTDANGEATFTVEAGGAGTATVEAAAAYTLPAGTIFHGTSLERQKLLLADSQEGVTSADTTTIWQVAQGAITVNIFHDRDINGLDAGADNGEEDLEGWVVKLFDADGNVAQTATTNDQGLVFFNNVPNGDYTVSYTLQPTWLDTNGDEPATEASVSETITVDNDSHYEDMGVIQTPFVDVCVYFDNNGDGELNGGESLLSGWDVDLFRENGSAVVGAGGTTDEDGNVILTFHRHSDFTLGGTNYFTALIEQDAWQALQDADGDSDNGVATSGVFTLTENMYEQLCHGVEPGDEKGKLPFGDEKCGGSDNLVQPITWTVVLSDANGVVTEVAVENGTKVRLLDQLTGTGSVTVKSPSGLDLEGWTVTISDKDGNAVAEKAIDASGEVTFDNLSEENGTYELVYTIEGDDVDCGDGGLAVDDIKPTFFDMGDSEEVVDGE